MSFTVILYCQEHHGINLRLPEPEPPLGVFRSGRGEQRSVCFCGAEVFSTVAFICVSRVAGVVVVIVVRMVLSLTDDRSRRRDLMGGCFRTLSKKL